MTPTRKEAKAAKASADSSSSNNTPPPAQLKATPDNYQPSSDYLLTYGEAMDYTTAALTAGVDPCQLLGLSTAESGDRNPLAERWKELDEEYIQGLIKKLTTPVDGSVTAASGVESARNDLQAFINAAWPDISFGRSQRIVKYHELGNQADDDVAQEGDTPYPRRTVENVLAVREAVFSDPLADLTAMAQRFAGCFPQGVTDPILACARYNGGPAAVVWSDSDGAWVIAPWYREQYGEHLRSYTIALQNAERYRATEATEPALPTETTVEVVPEANRLRRALDVQWGNKERLRGEATRLRVRASNLRDAASNLADAATALETTAGQLEQAAKEFEDTIVAVKEETGLQAKT